MCKATISVHELLKKFPDEDSARKYLEGRRWAKGIICPYCDSDRITRQKEKQYLRCRDCRKVFTVRTHTVFERSHISLDKWLYAMYSIATARKGISSLQLSKELGITQKSAWFLLHRLREACGDDTGLLAGVIEVDETYIGGKKRNKHTFKRNKFRGTVGKQAVLGMRERQGKTKAMPIENTGHVALRGNISKHVAIGSTVYTDNYKSYVGLNELYYNHQSVNHSAKEYVNGIVHTNGIESVWALLKRGYYGTYHHFSVKHLRRYVNEFAFRLNEGNVENHILERIASLCDKVVGHRITYKSLTCP